MTHINAFDSETMTIHWDNTVSSIVNVSDTEIRTMSPMEILSHECDHANAYIDNPAQVISDSNTTSENYGNKEEERVILNSETIIARKLKKIDNKSYSRMNHHGQNYSTPYSNPTEDEIWDYIESEYLLKNNH